MVTIAETESPRIGELAPLTAAERPKTCLPANHPRRAIDTKSGARLLFAPQGLDVPPLPRVSETSADFDDDDDEEQDQDAPDFDARRRLSRTAAHLHPADDHVLLPGDQITIMAESSTLHKVNRLNR